MQSWTPTPDSESAQTPRSRVQRGRERNREGKKGDPAIIHPFSDLVDGGEGRYLGLGSLCLNL